MGKEAKALGESGERMVPELHKGSLIYAEHMTRYLAGQQLVHKKVVLDIASGSGYGSKILAEYAKKVYGVDVEESAIKYAQKYYSGTNIEYLVGDGQKIPLDDASVDVVVTLETIEHIPDYEKFIKEIKRVLKPDGLAVVSTPNDLEFAEGNHYHLHEFTYNELINLLKRDFKYIDSYFQATWKYVALGAQEEFGQEGFINLDVLNYSPPKPDQYLYFFLLCSNRQIGEKIKPVAALGDHYSDRYYLGQQMQHEKNIADYKKVLQECSEKAHALEERLKYAEEEADRLNINLKDLQNSKLHKFASKIRRVKGIFKD